MLVHHRPSPALPKRVVILGGSGFIGRHLSARLEQLGCDRLALASADIDLTKADTATALAGMLRADDAVVFLSCLTPRRGKGVDTLIANMAMAETVCAALDKTPVSQLVYLSSDAVYAFDNALITANTLPSPTDLYGAMHLSRELTLGQSVACPLAVLRSTLLYGADDPHNSYGPNRLRRVAAKDGKITLFGGGEETRDHLFVEDMVELLLEVLRHQSAGLLNAASGRSISYLELAEKVAAQFDPPATVETTPRKNPITHRRFDPTELHMAFPKFAMTALEDGLARVHREMVENGHA